MKEHGKCCTEDGERRSFLTSSWGWLKLAAFVSLLLPFFRFISDRIPRKKRYVKIEKNLAVVGYHIDTEFVLFDNASGIWAVSRTCTHLGCRLHYREKDHVLICPCHQSIFTSAGKRIDGPAKKDLPVYVATRMEGKDKPEYIIEM